MTKEIETKINRLIGKLNTVDSCSRIERKARERRHLIHNRKAQNDLDQQWSEVKDLIPGDIVRAEERWSVLDISGERGMIDHVSAGEEFVVWYRQPRARRLWLLRVNDWSRGIDYAVEVAGHVARLWSLYDRKQISGKELVEAWDYARKKAEAFTPRELWRCKIHKISHDESFGADNVDRESEQA